MPHPHVVIVVVTVIFALAIGVVVFIVSLGFFALASSSSANTALLWVLRLRPRRLGACVVVVVFVAGAVRVLVVVLHLGHLQRVLGVARLSAWAAPASARRYVNALVRFALAHAPLARPTLVVGGWEDHVSQRVELVPKGVLYFFFLQIIMVIMVNRVHTI
jgi:hypothetical protein